jgi:cellulose synthase/poly-beta-1,6-N-acetylglucosamine synthase-like glycosyltransferase
MADTPKSLDDIKPKFSKILGLPIANEPSASATPAADEAARFELSVIIPARNEELNLETCLASLLAQDDEFFKLGRDWELIVVDDASTDRTRAIANSFVREGMTLLEAPPLELRATQRAFTGKTQACWVGAQHSQGRRLLFTDADTIHEPGDLGRALHEAKKHNVALLSYSPRQIVTGLAQRALMPLVFSELASTYPPKEVNHPGKRLAAANGQFLLVDRAAYFAAGGHRAVGRSVLEDVDLAWNIKRAGARNGNRYIRLRYAPDAVSTRMYRTLGEMMEGWEKNLALLFPQALALAIWRMLDLALLLLPLLILVLPFLLWWQDAIIWLLWLRTLARFYGRVRRSNFGWLDCLLSVFALPLFIYLLVRSWMNHRLFHRVSWKGREYRTGR